MAIFVFHQNNVRGVFVGPEKVAVEATDAEEAHEAVAEAMERGGEWCECCGPRWGTPVKEVQEFPEGMARVWN